jgi:hypothetical protein
MGQKFALQLSIADSKAWHHLTGVLVKLLSEDRLRLSTFACWHGLILPVSPLQSLGGVPSLGFMGTLQSQRLKYRSTVDFSPQLTERAHS